MKTNQTPSRTPFGNTMLLFCLLSALCLLASLKVAHAGTWVPSYQCNGSTQASGGQINNLQGIQHTWPANGGNNDPYASANPFGNNSFSDGDYIYVTSTPVSDPYQCSGTVQATLTWSPTAGEAPPALQQTVLSVVEYSKAWSSIYSASPDTMTVTALSDGFSQDSVIFTNPVPAQCECMQGYHLTQVPVHYTNGQWVATLPVRHLNVSGTYGLVPVNNTVYGYDGNFYVNYDVIVSPSTLQGWSTACAPALVGNNPANGTPTNWDSYNPRYFSGTGCEVQGTAVPLSGYITQALLCIANNSGDEVVKEYEDISIAPNPLPGNNLAYTGNHVTSAPLKALFDSTHFKDNTMIVLKLKVWDSNGGHYEGAVQGPAYNKAKNLGNNTPDFNVSRDLPDIVTKVLQNSGYTATSSESLQKNDILPLLPNLSAFYISTHGNSNEFGDCDAFPKSSAFSYLFGSGDPTSSQGGVDITTKISQKTSAQPPYNFVFADGCETASTNLLAEGFKVKGADQAFLGWIQSYFIDQEHHDWTERFIAKLGNGQTIRDAVIQTDSEGLADALSPPPQGWTGAWPPNYNSPPPTGWTREWPPKESLDQHSNGPPAAPFYYGDPAFKLHGVFNSTIASAGLTNWFKPL